MNKSKHIVILGAGPTGITTAWELINLGHHVTVLEKQSVIGGTGQSFKWYGIDVDLGPHKFYTQIPRVEELFQSLYADKQYYIHDKKSSIFLKNKYFSYPFSLKELLLRLNFFLSVKVLFQYKLQLFKNIFVRKPVVNYEDFVVKKFGKGLYHLVFKDLAEKVWGPPKELSKIIAEKRISMPGLITLIFKLIFKSGYDKTQNANQFYYPKQRGISDFVLRMAEQIQKKGGNIVLDVEIESIKGHKDAVQSVSYKKDNQSHTLNCDWIVSTIPIPSLFSYLPQSNSDTYQSALAHIRYRDVMTSFFYVNKPQVSKDHWIFFPERKFTYSRFYEQTNFEPDQKNGKTIIGIDYTLPESATPETLKTLTDKALSELCSTGLIKETDILDQKNIVTEKFYPVCKIGYEQHLSHLLNIEKDVSNLLLLGRVGLYNYNNTDQCMDMGLTAAQFISEHTNNSDWPVERKKFDEYKIVD